MRELFLLVCHLCLCRLEYLTMLPLRVECVHPRDNGIQASKPIIELFVKYLL